MTASKITPCLWFNGEADEAARLYTAAFRDVTILTTSRYGDGMPRPAGETLVIEIDLMGRRFQLLNAGPEFRPTPSLSFFVHLENEDETKRMFDALSPGGRVMMPPGAYPWSPSYAWVEDRFGVSWQLIAGRRAEGEPRIMPSLMFAGAQQGRAAEAMRHYTSVFGGGVESLEHYAPAEGPETFVKHARFRMAGEIFAASDSHVPHGFDFNEGVSLSVTCRDQAEVDRVWDALRHGDERPICGWIKDRFGVSWQVVPARIMELEAKNDPVAMGRMFQAMLTMERLDVAALEMAYFEAE